jgi:alcohol-forming fatty acyl-CoA reductase
VIAKRLAGKKIAITGATGFLGTALVERLLRSVPDCEVVCIVRPTRKFSPMERVMRELIRNDCFDRLRGELGDKFDTHIEKHLSAIAGDVSSEGLGLDDEGRAVLATCDVVMHSAATVSFESPLDMAVEVNLLGPTRVANAIRASGSKAHLVAVSTCYVAGNRRGDAYEELVTDTWYSPEVDWRREVTAGRRALADAENDSRQLERLHAFRKQARRELGAAGNPLLSERTEKLRQEWVRTRLVEQGKARANSLGWPDVYAYTKALGERALLESRGDIPVSFVRPSIIESALQEPVPGWIRGFRMAEPILLGVGKGLLKTFPGAPDGVLDVIPVDKVVATIIAVAALADGNNPSVYQIASGTRQPLQMRNLVDLVTGYYRANPLYDTNGQPIIVNEWQYPVRGKVERQLSQAIFVLDIGERVLNRLPVRGRPSDFAGKLEEQRTEALKAQGYVDIYSAYTQSEARFSIDRSLELYNLLDEKTQREFNFDPIDIDWKTYLWDIHLPSVIAQGRVRTTPGKKKTVDQTARMHKRLLSPNNQVAVFDLENTLLHSNVLESYIWLATRHLKRRERVALTLRKLPLAPGLFRMDRLDRGDFLRTFYRWFAGAPVAQLQADTHEMFNEYLLKKCFPDGLARIRAHREAGHRTMLITGVIDVVVEPLRPLFDDIICARLAHEDGVYTGDLLEPPPVGEARALALKDYAERNNIDLDRTVAYADSSSDLPLLEAVGNPVAINPEPRLAAIARRRGWAVERWRRQGNVPAFPFPKYVAPRQKAGA